MIQLLRFSVTIHNLYFKKKYIYEDIMDIKDKTSIITGAARGLGAAMAKRLISSEAMRTSRYIFFDFQSVLNPSS